MEGSGVVIAGGRFGVTCLAVFLRFSQLRNDGDSQELLASKLNSGLNGFLVAEFNISDTR